MCILNSDKINSFLTVMALYVFIRFSYVEGVVYGIKTTKVFILSCKHRTWHVPHSFHAFKNKIRDPPENSKWPPKIQDGRHEIRSSDTIN